MLRRASYTPLILLCPGDAHMSVMQRIFRSTRYHAYHQHLKVLQIYTLSDECSASAFVAPHPAICNAPCVISIPAMLHVSLLYLQCSMCLCCICNAPCVSAVSATLHVSLCDLKCSRIPLHRNARLVRSQFCLLSGAFPLACTPGCYSASFACRVEYPLWLLRATGVCIWNGHSGGARCARGPSRGRGAHHGLWA